MIYMSIKITDVRAVKGDSAFLIDDGKTSVLYDTGFGFTGLKIAENIKHILKDRDLDYIFLTHSHYDHALGAAYIKSVYKNAKVVAGEYAKKIFAKPSALKLMRELDEKFARKNGIESYEDLSAELSVDIACKDGDKVCAGDMCFTAIELLGHTRCSVGYYLEDEGLLLGTESLGVYTGDSVVVPSYLVGYRMVLDSIRKVMALNPRKILVPHYGVICEKEAQDYLKSALDSATATAEEIVEIIRAGGTKDDAVAHFVSKFYTDKVREVYPYDAMMLNTSISVDLLIKELM